MASENGHSSVPSGSRRGDRKLVGGLLVFLLTLTAFVGSLVLLIPMLPLIFVPVSLVRDCFRVYAATYGAMWFGLASGLLERLGGTKIRVYGEPTGWQASYQPVHTFISNIGCLLTTR